MTKGSLVLFPSGKPRYVIDRWPVLEWLKNRQPQADVVRRMIERAATGEIVLLMSIVNLGEVYYTSAKEWGVVRAEEVLARMEQLPISLIPAFDAHVLAAARLKAVHRISYADAFGASLAMEQRCPLVTGDLDFRLFAEAGLLRLEWLGA